MGVYPVAHKIITQRLQPLGDLQSLVPVNERHVRVGLGVRSRRRRKFSRYDEQDCGYDPPGELTHEVNSVS